ncbi:MAG: alpha-L-rhamnosidase C-terminal domain-containing protein, partial [Bacteroidota bacterium]
YGDWCVPPETLTMIFSEDPARKTPGDYLSTAFYYDMLKIMIRFAAISNNKEDVEYFTTLAKNVKEGFNRKFFNAEKKCYANNTTTANVLALAFDMVPETLRPAVFEQIVDKTMNEAKGHITTGLIGIQQLMRTLTNNGRPDIAYLLATTTTYPGWGYMLTQGATTIWELWNGNTANPAMNSANHVMMIGDLLTWYYENLAGIKSASPGFKEIVMKPLVAKDLKFVKASYESPYGIIASNWSNSNNSFEWNIEIPANCKAVVYIPASSVGKIKESGKAISLINEINVRESKDDYVKLEIGSGKYDFSVN